MPVLHEAAHRKAFRHNINFIEEPVVFRCVSFTVKPAKTTFKMRMLELSSEAEICILQRPSFVHGTRFLHWLYLNGDGRLLGVRRPHFRPDGLQS